MRSKILLLVLISGILVILTEEGFVQQVSKDYAVIADYRGQVQVIRGKTAVSVKKGLLLYENDRIKTMKNSDAVLIFRDGSSVSLGENTDVVIRDLIEKISISLDRGKVKTKVVSKQTNKVFEIRTPVSVASVRGTEFILIYENNISELYVLDGEVNFEDILGNTTVVSSMEQCFATEQGLQEKSLIDKEKIKVIKEEFRSIKDEFQKGKKEEIDTFKQELKDFVLETKTEKNYIYEFVQQVKEADFQAGRTLRDVHGNLTRVEQIISRNKDNNIEFMNITKRDSYVYKGYFDYADIVKSNKPRIDIFRLGIEFNTSLPQKISQWPSFIAEKGKDFWPTRVYLEITNLKDRFYSETTFTKVVKEEPVYIWEPKFNEFGHYIGDEPRQIGTKKEEVLESKTKNIVSNGAVEYNIDTDYDENVKGKLPEGKHKEEEDGKLWFWVERPLPVKEDINNDGKSDNKDILWLQLEGYLINNEGKVLTPSYFTSGENKDPFNILKEVAVESCIFVRKYDADSTGTFVSFFNKNIDLVFTPDIIISLAKTMVLALKDTDF
ncbi:MAG: FecR family protein [Endomicrobia bacterium]|nr:FecR family protein [Endomicrobiia bacterium]